MIDEKTIKEAMSSYAKGTWNHDEERFAAMDGFKEGAKWMQDKFIESLWHSPEMCPENNREIILISEKGLVHCWNLNNRRYWAGDVKDYNIERWCYIDDILPKSKEL